MFMKLNESGILTTTKPNCQISKQPVTTTSENHITDDKRSWH